MKTYTPKPQDITRNWHLVDAQNQTLGRLASQVAVWLMGKHKPISSRHLDVGDHVVVTNAAQVKVSGRKETRKAYWRHSGYPGGMKTASFSQMRVTYPDRLIIHAVSGMLPKNKLKNRLLTHLHVYSGPDHPYTKQFKYSL